MCKVIDEQRSENKRRKDILEIDVKIFDEKVKWLRLNPEFIGLRIREKNWYPGKDHQYDRSGGGDGGKNKSPFKGIKNYQQEKNNTL